MDTGIANAMELAEEQTTLDRHVVNLFSHKSILAILMKYCVREFEGYSADFIVEHCFVGEPVVRKMAVDRDTPDAAELPIEFQGLEEEESDESMPESTLKEPDGLVSYDAIMLDGNERIMGIDTVDKTQNEGTVIYDIIFLAKVPGTNELIQLIINVEIQNDQKLKYYVETRGIYYCARMISAQKNRTFRHSEYEKIRKVYSIWICPYAKSGKNTVTTYNVNANKVFGDAKIPKDAYDKLEMVIITLNAKGLESTNDLIKYLSLLLNHEIPLTEREKQLETEYHLQMTEEIQKEAKNVCNYSSALVQQGVQQGMKQGMKQGIPQGENKLGTLMTRMREAGRIDDAFHAATDPVYREKMYKVFNISQDPIPAMKDTL